MNDRIRLGRVLLGVCLAATTASALPAWDAEAALPRDSLYQLDVPLTDQSGRVFRLADHRGEPMLVSMFYTSCSFTCPLLVEAIRADEDGLTTSERLRLKVLLVSFDAARDTPAVLQRTADERHVDSTRWQLARTDAGGVRKVAAVLRIPYRRLENGDFNHATTIVLVDGDGRIVGRTSDLSGADQAFTHLVKATIARASGNSAAR